MKTFDVSATCAILQASDVLTVELAALYTHLSEQETRRRCQKHTIPFYKQGVRVLFDKEELKRWMLSVRVPTEDEVEAKACTINAIRKINNARNGKI